MEPTKSRFLEVKKDKSPRFLNVERSDNATGVPTLQYFAFPSLLYSLGIVESSAGLWYANEI